ncbi:MAG: GDSL-type esterase/lipase family protein [Burkholderiales bacterium]
MTPSRRQALVRLGGWLAAAPLTAGLMACSRPPVKGERVPPGAPVLALGDSLTYGTGATAGTAYPAVLAGLTGWQVVNAGVPGHVSAQALERLPGLLNEHRPALVLLGIGGNDFLRRLDEAQTERNVRSLVEGARAGGAQVLLIAVPRPTVAARLVGALEDHPLYERVAEALRVPLHANGWSEVLADEALRADAIHANAQGYAAVSRGLVETLRKRGLLAS